MALHLIIPRNRNVSIEKKGGKLPRLKRNKRMQWNRCRSFTYILEMSIYYCFRRWLEAYCTLCFVFQFLMFYIFVTFRTLLFLKNMNIQFKYSEKLQNSHTNKNKTLTELLEGNYVIKGPVNVRKWRNISNGKIITQTEIGRTTTE